MAARYTGPGKGIALDTFDGIHTVKVSAEDTGGAYELFEVDAPRGPAVPMLRTPWAKAFYLLAGTMTVHVEGEHHELEPGATITIPDGAAHAFEVTTPTARFLAFTLTDAAGRLFADIVASIPPGRSMQDLAPLLERVAHRHGVTFAADDPP
ncbi:cupin domain-containing protein [Pseudonocardia sp. GCM10023141]|uniref:cupin domain-containing protein n=1 Tax=Pseudonocardia sp. GCM10023141 TaxID=3252653 RepID=UPI003607E178